MSTESLLIARGKNEHRLLPKMANRHGLIAGATGTGKTVSLRVLAEGFSSLGTPVFLADVKGDLSGLCRPGEPTAPISARAQELGISDLQFAQFPVTFWDVFGQQGHPVRATISEMGPLLLSRLLNLNETQSGVLTAIFRIADDNGLLLLDLKDLRSLLAHTGDHAAEYRTKYGNISSTTIGAIQRGLLSLEEQGGDVFFGEPALDFHDLLRTDSSGKGMINILAADRLLQSPKIYATFLLWLLSELFERLPEVGDLEKPKLVFFFDEAHLLFDDAPTALLEKIETVIRLVRSKGVGVYFVTQNSADIPDQVLGQLGNRIQHALRAFSPKDQKALRAAAQTFRTDDPSALEKSLTELAVGEAIVSFLDAKGAPTVAERALVYPPKSRLTPLAPDERQQIIRSSLLAGRYEEAVDRESAYEQLQQRAGEAAQQPPERAPRPAPQTRTGSRRQTPVEAFVSSTVRSIGRQIGNQIVRGILGSLLGGKGRR